MTETEEDNSQTHIRQVSLTSTNQNVFLISTFKEENTDFLIRRALKCLRELKKNE